MRNKVILLALALVLVACKKENKAEQYLGCYALEPSAKYQCVNDLAQKYISADGKQDQQYVKLLQYEYEKLGFKEFLNSKNLSCNHIIEAVLYDDEYQEYKIKCPPNHEYFMRFDYNAKRWELVR